MYMPFFPVRPLTLSLSITLYIDVAKELLATDEAEPVSVAALSFMNISRNFKP